MPTSPQDIPRIVVQTFPLAPSTVERTFNKIRVQRFPLEPKPPEEFLRIVVQRFPVPPSLDELLR